MKQGELSKVTIRAFRDKKRRNQEVGSFKLPINPEGYSRNFKIQNDQSQAQGKGGNDPKYDKTIPEQLKLDFYFDNTGTVQGNHLDGTPVPRQIEDFLEIVYETDADKHGPLFLKVAWGSFFLFDCKLEDLSIEYKLFDPSGEPLRAKISANFIEYTEKEEQERKDGKQSPDLTKIRKVSENDALPLMSYHLYGDSKYYWQIAEINNLTTFRKLKAGQKLVFPSFKKDNE
ncbi:MAG: hypothetical protein AAF806_10185 [Bacteroidota bacterium]